MPVWPNGSLSTLVTAVRSRSTVEMRKQSTTARYLPLEPVAELRAIHLHQHQIVLSGEVFGGGFDSLRGGREMNEAVLHIDRRAAENTGGFGPAP